MKVLALKGKRVEAIAFAAFASALAGCSGGGSDPPAPTASLDVDPSTVTLGQSARLTWSSSMGTTCEASGGWSGAMPPTGAADVTPTTTGSVAYTLTCSGGGFGGSALASATLTVEPASAYTATSLVEDFTGGASRTVDDLLLNPWGLAFGPTSAMWVTNNHSDTATIYDGNGRSSPLVVHVVPGFGATGIVFNGSMDFAVSGTQGTGPALFILAGESGRIAGWSPNVDTANAVTVYTSTEGAVYKGLATANDGSASFVYATDFANGKIDVLDTTFAKQERTAARFAFDDPMLPAGYAPFGIQAFADGATGAARIYVTYAQHADAEPSEEVPGAGLGIVDVFDAGGKLLKRLVSEGGKLNAPWGLALAPAEFGTLSNALLVGNFGDGTIQGYDPATGRYLGAVTDGSGAPFALPGLWGIRFGNDAVNQPHAALFFAAGLNGEANGRYGRIDLGQTQPALGEPPMLTIIAPQGDLSGTITLTANAQNLVPIVNVQFFVNGATRIGTATSEPFTIEWDTTAVSNGSATLRAVATDPSGNVGSSQLLTVSVANAAAVTTLTDVQQIVFTPRCAACHDGSQPPGGVLPGAMDLRPGHSFTSLVNVASAEQPALMRVKPGEPESSYVIHKLDGSPGIAGARMPFGGPFLDAPTIDRVRAWISSGARND